MKVPVYIKTTASHYLGEIEIDKPEDFTGKAEELWEKADYDAPSLCHQCSHELDLGEFDFDETEANYYFKNKPVK